MAKQYKFKGLSIGGDQADTIRQIAVLGKAGLLNGQSAAPLIVQTLLQKPSKFQSDLTGYLSTKGQGQAQPTQSRGYSTSDYLSNQTNSARFQPAQQNPTNMQPQETPGTFGFGTGKGQLFGEGGFVAGLTQPLRQGIANPLAALLQTGAGTFRDISQGKSLQDALANPNNAIERQTPFAVSQQENRDYMADPLAGGVKAGIGIGSYAVPVGRAASIPQAIGLGAGAGGLFGLGTSRPGQEVNNTLAGAVGGGLTAGVLKAAQPVTSAIGSKINSLGRDLETSGLRVKAGTNPTGVLDAQALRQQGTQILQDEGVTAFNGKGVGQAYNSLSNKLQSILKGSKASGDSSSILTDALERASQEVDLGGSVASKNVNVLTSKISNLGQNPTAAQLAGIKSELQGTMSALYKKIANGNALTEKENITKAFHDAIDNQLKSIEPATVPIYEKLSTLYDLGDAIKTFDKGSRFSHPLTGSLAIPTGGATRGTKQVLGNALQQTPTLNSQNVQQIAPYIGALLGIQQSQYQPPSPSSQGISPIEGGRYSTELPQQQTTADPNLLAIIQQGVATGEISPSDARNYMDVYGLNQPSQPRISVLDQQRIDNARQGINELNTIEELFSTANQIQSGLPPFIQSAEAQQLENAITNAMDLIARARTGAAMPPSEREVYRNMFPRIGSDPATIRAQLDRIYNELVGTATYGQ